MADINPRRVEQQIRNFQKAITAYNYNEPFARFINQFFKNNRQMGSSDRRMTSRLCYNYFRLGNGFRKLEPLERLIVAEFLCEQYSDIVALYQPTWTVSQTLSIVEKVSFLATIYGSKLIDEVFPFSNELSTGIDRDTFLISHFVQPDLFIRVKRGKESFVEQCLLQAGVRYKREIDQVYRLPNGTKLQDIDVITGAIEVQDFSSQQSLDTAQINAGETWWDACAASGGKSLLLLDKEPSVKLLVSDLRMSILRNLDERFQKSNIRTNYRKKIIDLKADIRDIMRGESFDGIILDAPCSGSGTWGRTPEMIQQCSEESIRGFSKLQKEIVSNIAPYVKPGGQLIYITCSVFADENEEILMYIQENCGLVFEEGGVIPGYHRQSDSMYSVRLRKPF